MTLFRVMLWSFSLFNVSPLPPLDPIIDRHVFQVLMSQGGEKGEGTQCEIRSSDSSLLHLFFREWMHLSFVNENLLDREGTFIRLSDKMRMSNWNSNNHFNTILLITLEMKLMKSRTGEKKKETMMMGGSHDHVIWRTQNKRLQRTRGKEWDKKLL